MRCATADSGQSVGTPTDTRETYDLVVVGGGISGLSAAHFYRQRAGQSARILVLDNHDDFGGHAKRNEFHLGGRMLLMNGGTAGIDSPTKYSATADGLLKSLGVDPVALTARTRASGRRRSERSEPAQRLLLRQGNLRRRQARRRYTRRRRRAGRARWRGRCRCLGSVCVADAAVGQSARRLAPHPVRRCRGLSAGRCRSRRSASGCRK